MDGSHWKEREDVGRSENLWPCFPEGLGREEEGNFGNTQGICSVHVFERTMRVLGMLSLGTVQGVCLGSC